MRAVQNANGSRLHAGGKMRGMVWATAGSPSGWGRAWAAYNSAQWEARMALAASVGVNSLEMQCTGIGVGVASPGGYYGGYYPPLTTLYTYVADFIRLCRKYNMGISLCNGGASEIFGTAGTFGAQNMATLQTTNGWFASLAPDLMMYYDIMNEVGFNRPSSWSSSTQKASDYQSLLALCRSQFPGVPMTASVYLYSKAEFSTNIYLQEQAAMGCDFHAYHCYYGNDGNVTITPGFTPIPAGSDPLLLEQQSWFIGRHAMTECGLNQQNSPAAKTAWFAGIGDQLRRPLSLGGNSFVDQDFPGSFLASTPSPSNAFGVFFNGAPLTASTNEISRWPKVI